MVCVHIPPVKIPPSITKAGAAITGNNRHWLAVMREYRRVSLLGSGFAIVSALSKLVGGGGILICRPILMHTFQVNSLSNDENFVQTLWI